MNSLSATAAAATTPVHARGRVLVALPAFLLGLTLFVAAGFAWPGAVHNATHDMRHSLGLPCH